MSEKTFLEFYSEANGKMNSGDHSGDRKGAIKNYTSAIKDYTKCIELDPNNADCFMQRSEAKSHLQDHKGAVEDLTEYVNLKPKDPIGFSMRASAKARSKDFDGAILDYEKTIDLGYDKSHIDKHIGDIKHTQEIHNLGEKMKKDREEVMSKHGFGFKRRESISKKLENFKEQKQEQKNENEIEL